MMTESPPRMQHGGVILVDKPAGPTSHDVVTRVRRSLDIGKVGHAGTLDPFATGLLVVLVGAGTRLAEYLTGLPKRYEATAILGERTDTLDPEGAVVERDDAWKEVDEGSVRTAMEGLTGEIHQIPPQFSAKKVEGEAMYRKARRGEVVALEPVPVRISELELVELSPPRIRFRATCSAGTYVRALARDLGAALGTCARLEALRRTRVGQFSVEEAVPFEFVAERIRLEAALLSLRQAVAHLPVIRVGEDAARRLAHGQAVPEPASRSEPGEERGPGPVAVCVGDALAAVGRVENGMLVPRKVFVRV